tara:strand:+ start:1183 stop:1851 length:669 start_codon:yes stop_codon:yes gene_type:complete
MSKLFKICDSGLKLTFSLFGKLEIEGKENVPENGSFITVANHLSIIDPALCASAVGREPKFLAKKELFKFPFNILLKFYGAYPINRTRPGSSAIKWVKEQLQTKESSLLIFPEGTRSRDLRLQKGLNGATMIAIDTQSIILPVSIVGSEKCKNYLQFLFPKMSVKIKIGKPFNIVNLPEKKDKDLYQIITKEIMQRISNMLPQAYKDDEDELEFCYTRAIEN